MKALIDEKNQVAQVTEQAFDVASPMFWVDCDSSIEAYKYTYENGVFVPVQEEVPSLTAEDNKKIAEDLLLSSDWVMLSDVSISNKSEWETYRASVRAIARNPQSGNISWPTRPQKVWA